MTQESGKKTYLAKVSEKGWVNLGSVKEGKKGNIYLQLADNVKITLDGEEISSQILGLFAPNEDAPSFVQYNVSVNLNND